MRRQLFGLGLILVLLALLTPPAVAATGNDVARGHGAQFSTQFDFNAQSNFNGTEPSGYFTTTNTNTDPNSKFVGNVTCLNVVGNTAVMSGDITSAPPGSIVRSYIAKVVDVGKPGAGSDQFGGIFLLTTPPPPPTCLGAFTVFTTTITEGDIIVKDAI